MTLERKFARHFALACGLVALSATAVFAEIGAENPSFEYELANSNVRVSGWVEGASGETRYTIERDGVSHGPVTANYELRVRNQRFDPLRDGAPATPEGLSGGDIYFVQFNTRALGEYRDALAELGATVHKYFPNQSYLVEVPGDALEDVRSLSFVRWVGRYEPIYRTEPLIQSALQGIGSLDESQIYTLRFFTADADTKRTVATRIATLGGEVLAEKDGKFNQRARMPKDLLRKALAWNEVMYIDRWAPMEEDMDIVRSIGGANFLESVEGYTGQGVRGEVFDSGFNLGHDDFQSGAPIEHNNVSSGSHGASTSGIIFGDGANDPRGRGLMPDAQMIVGDYDLVGLDSPNRYDYTGELLSPPYNAVFQSCSAGSPRTFLYTTTSALMDTILFDFDLAACQSQSNAGNQDSRPQAWAKNVIAVGGVRHLDTPGPQDDNWGFGGSIGPAEDGRVKPDLAHFYENVYTPGWPGSDDYAEFSGTSAATPIVCGHVGLFFQMWADGIFGNPVDPNGSVFENRSHMTTAKAALVNTARQYNWLNGGPNSDIDRNKQGWGLPNLRGLYSVRDRVFVVDETDVIENLETAEYTIPVAAGQRLLKVTMVYADPAGVPGADMHRINNLSLEVISPSGTQYWGNNGLRQGLFSGAGGNENMIDTVENVFLQLPEAGDWTVRVHGTEIVEDGHVETGAVDADFALWVSGVAP